MASESPWQKHGGAAWTWLLIATLVGGGFGLVDATLSNDIEALLQFQAGLNGFKFESWDIANSSTVCSKWEGISCSNGRVNEVHLTGYVDSSIINGTISPALANLTELRYLTLTGMDLIGEFPPQIWALPRLSNLTMKGAKVRITFPDQVSQNIVELRVDGAKIDGPLPDIFNWTALHVLNLQATEMYCPLPAGLIARLKQGTLRCGMLKMPLEVIDDKVCGQISVFDFKCTLFPTLLPLRASVGNNDVLYTTRYGSLQLDFTKYNLNIYAVDSRGETYRREYLQLNFQPLEAQFEVNLSLTAGGQGPLEQFILTPPHDFTWVTPKLLHVNATMQSRVGQTMTCTLIFDFDRDDSNLQVGENKFKFSVRIINNDYNWGGATEAAINLMTTYHAQHSPEGGAPIYCGITTVLMRTSTMLMSFSYGLIGSFDGEPLSLTNTEVDAARFMPGIGVVNYVDMYTRYKRADLLPRAGPALNQSWNLALIIKTPIFQEFYYDPDIQMQLLFDVQSAPSDSNVAVGVGVGVSIGSAAAIATTVALVYFIRKRQVRRAEHDLMQSKLNSASLLNGSDSSGAASSKATPATVSPKPSGRWTSASIVALETKNTV